MIFVIFNNNSMVFEIFEGFHNFITRFTSTTERQNFQASKAGIGVLG
jgi:hypothetical protein